jgi:outer membrane receptor for ferrienterochelin and colicin
MHYVALAVGCGAAAVLVLSAGDSAAAPAVRSDAVTQGVARLKSLSLEELMAIQVATVTAASRKSEKASGAPAAVIVIDRRDILARGYATLKDVLRDLPGMETIEYYFSEIGTLVPVRGIVGNNKIVVLVNGMRVNPPGGENFPFRTDFSVRNAEKIEVVYGPGSTLYGQDAISAVINVITRRPPESEHGDMGLVGGMNDTREAWASFGGVFGPDGRDSLSGHVLYHASDLTELDRAYPAWWSRHLAVSDAAQPAGLGRNPAREDTGLNVFARVEVGDSSLQVWHRRSERNSAEGYGQGLGYLDEATWGDQSTVVEGKNTLTLTEATKLDSTVTYNCYEIDPSTRYVFPVSAADGGLAWFFDDYKYGLGTMFSGEETLHVQVNPDASFMAGVVGTLYDIIPKSTVPGGADTDRDVVSQGGSFVYTDRNGETRTIQRVVRERYETYAAYVEGGWQMRPEWKGILGTRVTEDSRFDDTPVTPRAALVYTLTEEWTAKYVFSRAYVAPAPYFGFATYDNGRHLATSNADLKPEEASMHEVNVQYCRPNLNLGASAYYGEEDSLILIADRGADANTLDPSVTMPDGSTRMLVHSVNGGSSKNYGFDLYGRGKVGDFSPWASYSYVNFEEEQGDVTRGLMGISRHNVRLGATWAPTIRLFITPSVVMRSTPQNVVAGALEDELSNPYEVNLHVLYRATKHVDTFVTARNLTNHKYALGGVTGDAEPQETFSALAGVSITF